MILENGVVRTMDPSLPIARALAIAGDLVAGGVGAHETALPSPDVVDLGGRCVVPGFTDSHVHFPTWSLAQRDVSLDGVSGLAAALERVQRASAPRLMDPWNGLALGRLGRAADEGGSRRGDWRRRRQRSGRRTTTRSGSTPRRSRSQAATSRSRAASSSATTPASRPGSSARSRRGSSVRAIATVPEDEWVDATRDGMRIAATPRRHGDPRQGRLARRSADLPAPRASAKGSRCASGSRFRTSSLPALAELGLRSGIGDDFLRIGYLKAFMDGTLGSQTAWMLDGSGVVITSGEELAEIVRARRRAGWPVACTRSATARTARRSTRSRRRATEWAPRGLRHRIEHAQCLAPEDVGRFAALGVACSVQFSHAPSDRDLAERFWPRPDRRRLRVPLAVGLGRARRERLGRARRGARPARRHPRGRAADDRRPTGVAPGAAR